MLFAIVVGPEKLPGCGAGELCGYKALKGFGQTLTKSPADFVHLKNLPSCNCVRNQEVNIKPLVLWHLE